MKPHIIQFFKFLEKKEDKRVPIRIKLLNHKDFKLSPEELHIEGDLHFWIHEIPIESIESLPDNLTVEGTLYLTGAPIKELPNNLTVGWNLWLNETEIESLPDNLTVGGALILSDSSIKSLPNDLTVNGFLDLEDTPIKELPDNLTVVADLSLIGASIESLPDNLKVKRHLYLNNTPLAKKYTKEQIRSMIEEKGGHVTGKIEI